MSLSILYEDLYCIAFDKPARLHSISNKNSTASSLADAIESEFPALTTSSEKPGEGGLVQRLDYDTSGIILAAKSREAWIAFRDLFRRHEVKKSYLAITEGEWEGEQSIDSWIGSRHRGAKKVQVRNFESKEGERFLPASSRFLVLEHNRTLALSLVLVTTTTGRRHQVRAHAAFLGHPLVGDTLYGAQHLLPQIATRSESLRDFFLHAFSLNFEHPILRTSVELCSPPLDLKELFPSFSTTLTAQKVYAR